MAKISWQIKEGQGRKERPRTRPQEKIDVDSSLSDALGAITIIFFLSLSPEG